MKNAIATVVLMLILASAAPSAAAQATTLASSAPVSFPLTGASQPASQPAADTLPPEELEKLLAPIALYPDVLLAQILPASTFPMDIVMAARWLRSNPDKTKLTGHVIKQPPANSHSFGRQPAPLRIVQANLPTAVLIVQLLAEYPILLFQVLHYLPGLLIEQAGEGSHHTQPCFLDHARRIRSSCYGSQSCIRMVAVSYTCGVTVIALPVVSCLRQLIIDVHTDCQETHASDRFWHRAGCGTT